MKSGGHTISTALAIMFGLTILFINHGYAAEPQVTAGGYHTVGLNADGTVVVVGDNDDGQCDVESWTDITQVAAGNSHTVGLRSDGTVVAVGYNDDGQCDVGFWHLGCDWLPGQVSLTTPFEMVETSKPSFVWEVDLCATWFRLVVETTGGEAIIDYWMLGREICSGGICSAPTSLSMGFENGDYTWMVQTWNEEGYGPESEALSFTVDVERDEH